MADTIQALSDRQLMAEILRAESNLQQQQNILQALRQEFEKRGVEELKAQGAKVQAVTAPAEVPVAPEEMEQQNRAARRKNLKPVK